MLKRSGHLENLIWKIRSCFCVHEHTAVCETLTWSFIVRNDLRGADGENSIQSLKVECKPFKRFEYLDFSVVFLGGFSEFEERI